MIESYPFRIETNGQMKKLFNLELQYKIGGEKVSRSERSPYSHDTRLLRTHTTLKRVGGECQVGVRTAGFRRPKTSVRLHQRINSSDKCLHPAGKRLLIQFPNVEIQKQIGLQISLFFADYSKLYFFYGKSLSQLTELRPSSSIRSSMQNWQNGAFYSFLGRGRAIRYDTRCYFNVRSKADISQLNLPHGTDN